MRKVVILLLAAYLVILLYFEVSKPVPISESNCLCSILTDTQQQYPIDDRLTNSMPDTNISISGTFTSTIFTCPHNKRIHVIIYNDEQVYSGRLININNNKKVYSPDDYVGEYIYKDDDIEVILSINEDRNISIYYEDIVIDGYFTTMDEKKLIYISYGDEYGFYSYELTENGLYLHIKEASYTALIDEGFTMKRKDDYNDYQ